MPRLHFVQKARKDNPAVKQGEPYYWWQNFRSPKRYSASRPRPSQLCSGRKSEVMGEQEALDEAITAEGVTIEKIREACEYASERFRELGEEYTDSADNMPESFQDGEQCENMRTMADGLDGAANELEYLDFEAEDREEYDDQDDWDCYIESFLENLVMEASSASENIEILF